MHRILCWPHTAVVPGLIASIQRGRVVAQITRKGMVRLELPLGNVEMKFANVREQLEPEAPVYVWWRGGGFVCAPIPEVDAEEARLRGIAERVSQARSHLASARKEREARLSHATLTGAAARPHELDNTAHAVP